MPTDADIQAFIDRWKVSSGNEDANRQPFLLELCGILEVDPPDPNPEHHPHYRFEKPIRIQHPDGHESTDSADFYKKDCFVLEAKQTLTPDDPRYGIRRGTPSWNKHMQKAFGQALKYASYLPEGRPPFLMTCDIGYVLEVWTGFSGDYGGYGARRTFRIEDLADPETRSYLATIFQDPWSLDPARHAAKVTREVASRLADLARTLEGGGHEPDQVARFLMRCLFTMFAEDVGLLPKDLFTSSIRDFWLPAPDKFRLGVTQFWVLMNQGGLSIRGDVIRRFNGGLFHSSDALDLNRDQIQLLLEAAECDWSAVEPAIFGTLLERALDKRERHKLGAHFTPREYIERLVRPTVFEPLREEWQAVQATVLDLLGAEDETPVPKARNTAFKALKDFHNRLCRVRILDPACGSGNFLYVSLDLLKELESEVLRTLSDLGEKQGALDMLGSMVSPQQFLGIEVNPRAREIADLVLWLGYLQWQRRTYGDADPPEPILHEFGNIVCRDAILDWDRVELRRDEQGKPVEVWDQHTTKTDPVTGRQVPDPMALVPVNDYINPREADWPAADFIVSNPPFVGNKLMREALGDGYVDALRSAWSGVPGSVDLVMYWWDKAARLVRDGKVQRFGFITTNSISQKLDRRVLESHLGAQVNPIAIIWTIPDHPWVDSGADVRISMTVGALREKLNREATIGRVRFEERSTARDSQTSRVELYFESMPMIHADLSGGVDVSEAEPLHANRDMSYQGVIPVGRGFVLNAEDPILGTAETLESNNVIRPYMNAKDLTAHSRGCCIIDFSQLDEREARDRYPRLFQRILETVKPERDQSKDKGFRERWWLFGRPRPEMRAALEGLDRFIVTPKTAKHRLFVLLDCDVLPDSKLYVFATDDVFFHGVLSSRYNVTWATKAGAHLGVGNDPTYNNGDCFDPFPFPDANEDQKARIRDLGERLDAHRKQVQSAHSDATLTAQYNALQRLREALDGGKALTDKERDFHDRALTGVLKSIHDDLDAAVAEAYGWPADLPEEEILERLVAMNRERATEEAAGHIRYLRPEFQAPDETPAKPTEQELVPEAKVVESTCPVEKRPWPRETAAQFQALRDVLALTNHALTADELASHFKYARAKRVGEHLVTLETLGLVVAYGTEAARKWGIAG